MPIPFASVFRNSARSLRLPGLNETQRFLMLSILIGVFAGLLVVCFHLTIQFIRWISIDPAPGASALRKVLSPAIGALIAVLLTYRVFRAARGSGVSNTKAAVYISNGRVPFGAVIGKFLACSVSIGTGNSLGPEDPSLHMGAGVASALGRAFRLTRERMRLIAPVGAAAGLAAAFNTPIAAVLFVIEEVVAGWSAAVLGSIVLSAVSAAVVVRWFLGDQPLFLVPQFELTSATELLLYALVGLIGGLLSVVFVRTIEKLRTWLERFPPNTAYLRSAAAGLAVGITGIWLPEVMGAGYDAIEGAMHNRFAWDMLVILALAKMGVTLLCFGAGTPGGMFAPTLFIGGMIGGGIGGLASLYWPFPSSGASAYVLVGMGTFFAGVFRAPMTSIFMVFEVSATYVIILPVMIANTVAFLVSRRLQPKPFFSMVARHEGLDLPSLEEEREAQPARVEDDMSPAAGVLDPDTTVAAALEAIQLDEAVLVSLDQGAWCHVSSQDLEAALLRGGGERKLRDEFPLTPLPRLFPDLPLETALRLLGSHPVLPVSSRMRPYRLLGVLTLRDVYRVYEIEEPAKLA
ncbi:MAG TPA: chloride channel protein [Bryobacteraceae bacterium]|nr:chloride channel protein [Bryobacteraceae bacterium]